MVASFVYHLVGERNLIREPDPDSLLDPAPGSIAIRTLYSAISPGTEIAAWKGMPPLRPTVNPYPRLMGYCHLGEVTAIGDGVEGIKLGQYVLSHSAHRSHAHLKVSEVLCTVDKAINPVFASTTYLFHLGYAACLKAGIVMGRKVAIVGLGTLGFSAAAVANVGGAQVTCISDYIPDIRTQRKFGIFECMTRSSAQVTHHNEFSVVIVTSNSWADWKLSLQLAGRGGQIIVLGFPGRGQPLPDFNPLSSQYFYDKQLRLAACGYVSSYAGPEIDIPFSKQRNCAYLLERIRTGDLPAAELVSEVRSAKDLPAIYDNMERNRKTGQTVVLDWSS